MRFLVDQNLSPRLAAVLGEHGHDAVHTSELGLAVAPDAAVMERARTDGRMLISADSDFGTMLASTRAVRPSIIDPRTENSPSVAQSSGLRRAIVPRPPSQEGRRISLGRSWCGTER